LKIIGKGNDISDPAHFGNSMAICYGDLGFFLAYDLLASQLSNKSYYLRVLSEISDSLTHMVLGEIEDVWLSDTQADVGLDKIISCYQAKTANYSVSLPLTLGAIISNKSDNIINKLKNIGMNIGTLFQIRDDDLNLISDNKKTGKSNGSDIISNKKTLLWYFANSILKGDNRKYFHSLYQKENIDSDQLDKLISIYKDNNIFGKIENYKIKLKDQTLRELDALDINKNSKVILENLLEYTLKKEI